MPPAQQTTTTTAGVCSSPVFLPVVLLCRLLYFIWYQLNKFVVDILQKHVSFAAGALFGTLVFEGYTIGKAAWYTWAKYRADPSTYGLNQWRTEERDRRPVLLLHGAAGSWSYLGDLAVALRRANVPIFVLNLGMGQVSNEMRKKVYNQIEEIRSSYPRSTTNGQDGGNRLPLVDIVAHSNGGNIALDSAFTETCSYIDEQGLLQFRSAPKVNPSVGKIITVALPSNAEETKWIRDAGKTSDLYNINARFDVLMAYKRCALAEERPSQVQSVDAAHIGIVFDHLTVTYILRFLRE